MLVGARVDNAVILLRAASPFNQISLGKHRAEILALAISPDGKYAASGDNAGQIKLWNIALRKEIKTLKGPAQGVFAVQFSPDSRQLVTVSKGITVGAPVVKLWNIQTNKEISATGNLPDWINLTNLTNLKPY